MVHRVATVLIFLFFITSNSGCAFYHQVQAKNFIEAEFDIYFAIYDSRGIETQIFGLREYSSATNQFTDSGCNGVHTITVEPLTTREKSLLVTQLKKVKLARFKGRFLDTRYPRTIYRIAITTKDDSIDAYFDESEINRAVFELQNTLNDIVFNKRKVNSRVKNEAELEGEEWIDICEI